VNSWGIVTSDVSVRRNWTKNKDKTANAKKLMRAMIHANVGAHRARIVLESWGFLHAFK